MLTDAAQTADSALSEFSIRGTTKNISEILSFKLTVERSLGESFLWLQVAPGEGVDNRYPVYLIYSYKSTNTDTSSTDST